MPDVPRQNSLGLRPVVGLQLLLTMRDGEQVRSCEPIEPETFAALPGKVARCTPCAASNAAPAAADKTTNRTAARPTAGTEWPYEGQPRVACPRAREWRRSAMLACGESPDSW